MKQRKAPVGAIEVTMASEEFNTLLAVLDEIIVCGADTKLGFYAKRLKEKMLRYSRRFIHRNTKKSVTYFFENEAALLIKLFAFYCNAVGIIGENYYDQIGKKVATNGKGEMCCVMKNGCRGSGLSPILRSRSVPINPAVRDVPF